MENIVCLLCLTLISTTFAINLRDSTKFHGNPQNVRVGSSSPAPPPSSVTTHKPNSTVAPSSLSHRQQNNFTSTLCNVKIFRKLRLPWMDAFGACKALGNGSELVSLRTQEDYSLVTMALRDFDSPLPVIFWTSGVDLVEEGTFSWMSDGTQVDMNQFWAAGQPDNLWDSEHCVGLRRKIFDKEYKMTDENCHLAGAFVCAQRCST